MFARRLGFLLVAGGEEGEFGWSGEEGERGGEVIEESFEGEEGMLSVSAISDDEGTR